ncbi:TPA: hypothetical protein ACYUXD_003587, partial [Escherichia coli]
FYQYPLNPVINVDPQGLVDINLYPESDLIHSVADEINIPGVFTIGGHGTPTSIESATRSIMTAKEGANKRGNSSRLTQSFHFFMFEPIFSPVNA